MSKDRMTNAGACANTSFQLGQLGHVGQLGRGLFHFIMNLRRVWCLLAQRYDIPSSKYVPELALLGPAYSSR